MAKPNTIYAQILGGIVQNIIILNDASLLPVFSKGFDLLLDITNLPPSACSYGYPGPGDSYDGNSFTQVLPNFVDQLKSDLNNANDALNSSINDASQADPSIVSQIQTLQTQLQSIQQSVTQQSVQAKLS